MATNVPVPTTTIYATTPAATVIPTLQQRQLNVKAISGLGVTQIVFGIIAIGIGIGSVAGLQRHYSGGGIWGGVWILVTGIIGVCSAKQPSSRCLLGFNMAFTIISCVVSIVDGIIFAVALAFYANCKWFYSYSYNYNYNSYYNTYNSYNYYYNSYDNYNYNYKYRYTYQYDVDKCFEHQDAGRALYAILLIIMVAEFFVALIASIYCCKGSAGCCGSQGTTGIILQQPQPQFVMTGTNGPAVLSTGNPHQNYPQQGFPLQSYPQQAYPAAVYPQQNITMAPTIYSYPPQSMQQTHITAPAPNFSTPGSTIPSTANANVSYSGDYQNGSKEAGPPPVYFVS